MHHFNYKQGILYCEDVSLNELAEKVGTPCYVYSHATLSRHVRVFDDGLKAVPHMTCFSVKANSNLGVLAVLGQLGCGADIVSGGELFRVLSAGIPANRVVFSGAGKQEHEIVEALRAKILLFNVESESELALIEKVANRLKCKAPIALRVNPDVDPKTHPYIATGLKKSKFGIPIVDARDVYRRAKASPNLELLGVDCHIGSQLTEVTPFMDAFKHVLGLVTDLRKEGIALRYVDIGGGLGIRYDETPPSPAEYGAQVAQALCDAQLSDVTVITEPGRVLVGNAGILLTRVLFRKSNQAKQFVIVDAAMNDLIRPALYEALHALLPVREHSDAMMEQVDVVGPICESGDLLAKDRHLPHVESGDLLAVMSAGAYGFAMSSNYNSRGRVAEVLVRGGQYDVVRARENYQDLVRGEKVPSWAQIS